MYSSRSRTVKKSCSTAGPPYPKKAGGDLPRPPSSGASVAPRPRRVWRLTPSCRFYWLPPPLRPGGTTSTLTVASSVPPLPSLTV